MERDELLSDQGRALRNSASREEALGVTRKAVSDLLQRQQTIHSYDSIWNSFDVDAAISRELLGKAERWKLLAREPLSASPDVTGHENGCTLPEVSPTLSSELDKHEVAAYYVNDALAGRESTVCIHDQKSLNALKVVRNKAWNQALNVCTIVHLALPMLEIQKCLPYMGPQTVEHPSDSLHQGWRPTILGTMWIECLLCLFYAYDLYLVSMSGGSQVQAHVKNSRGNECSEEKSPRRRMFHFPPWHYARTCMVFLLGIGLITNIFAHYVFRITWHRWSRVTLPFLFISRRTYLKHFTGGMLRVLPRMIPVVFLMSFIMFFYAFLAYILYRDVPPGKDFLAGLELFEDPASSALTFLRIFMSIPFMLDVEELYEDRKGIEVMGLSYGVIMVIFLGALVPAVANRYFQYQSKESYLWVNEQRKLALTRAYFLLKGPDGYVQRQDWMALMKFLRPDCDAKHICVLFDAAEKAEHKSHEVYGSEDHDRLSKGGFFMLCALGRASFSKAVERRFRGKWGWIRRSLSDALSWCFRGSTLPLSRQLYNVAVVIQGYQMVREGDDPGDRPDWAYPLGRYLIIYFCINMCLRIIAEGCLTYLRQWRHALGMTLNLIGMAYYMGLWPYGEGWRSLYHITQASRLMVLWNVLHSMGSTSSEVAKRLEFVFPAVLRASFVLFSVIYAYAVVAFAVYCATPLGSTPIEPVRGHPMVQRYALYGHVLSFGSLFQSFASMTDIVMLSNWPIFMDAAGDVGNACFAHFFFYSFKGLTFYFVMPVMLGFIVQSYMSANLPGREANCPAFSRRLSRQDPLIHDPVGGSNFGTSNAGQREDTTRSNEKSYGFSTFTNGPDKQIDVPLEQASDGDSLDAEEDETPVMVRAQRPSMSQAFWGAEQAKDQEGAARVSSTVDRLENDNAKLRALLENMQMELQMANARLYDEIQNQPMHVSSPKWASRRVGGNDRPGAKFSPESTPARKRLGSANSIGMEAIVESDEEFDRAV